MRNLRLITYTMRTHFMSGMLSGRVMSSKSATSEGGKSIDFRQASGRVSAGLRRPSLIAGG